MVDGWIFIEVKESGRVNGIRESRVTVLITVRAKQSVTKISHWHRHDLMIISYATQGHLVLPSIVNIYHSIIHINLKVVSLRIIKSRESRRASKEH